MEHQFLKGILEKVKSYRSKLLRFLMICIVSSVLMIIWALLNIYLITTPTWSDFMFGTTLLLGVFFATHQYGLKSIILTNKKLTLCWCFFLLVCFSFYYLELKDSASSNTLIGFLYAVQVLNEWVNEAITVKDSFESLLYIWSKLIVTYLIISVFIELFSILFWNSLEKFKTFISHKSKRAKEFNRFSYIRWGRIYLSLKLISLFLLLLIVASAGLSAYSISNIPNLPEGILLAGPQNFAIPLDLALDEKNNILLARSENLVFLSENSGETWIISGAGLGDKLLYELVFDAKNSFFYLLTNEGIYYSTNGDNWIYRDSTNFPNYPLTLSVNTNGSLYLGTTTGLYVSQNKGADWINISNNMGEQEIDLIEFDPIRKAIYVVSDNKIFAIFKNNSSWSSINWTDKDLDIHVFAVDQCTGNIFIQSKNGSTLYSKNGGASWESVSGLQEKEIFFSIVTDAEQKLLYAGTSNGLIRSSDGFQSFEYINSNVGAVKSLLISRNSGNIFLGTTKGIYRSTDKGTSWTSPGKGPKHIRITSLAMDKQNEVVYAATSKSLFRNRYSEDDWEIVGNGLDGAIINDIYVKNGIAFAGTSSGLFRSIDVGETWTSINNGLSNYDVYSIISSFEIGPVFAAISKEQLTQDHTKNNLPFTLGIDLREGVMALLDVPDDYQGTTTEQQLADAQRILENRTNALGVSENLFQVAGDRRMLAEFPGLTDPAQVLAVIKETGQLEFVDLGKTSLSEGTVITTDLGYVRINPRYNPNIFIGIVTFDNNDLTHNREIINLNDLNVTSFSSYNGTQTLYAGSQSDGILISQDEGKNWIRSSEDEKLQRILSISVDQENGTIYVGTDRHGLYHSMDKGENWVELSGKELSTESVHQIVLDPISSTLYVGTSKGVWKSNDKGKSWVSQNEGLRNENVLLLELDKKARVLYASTKDGGVYRSFNAGEKWESIDQGISDINIYSLAVDNQDLNFYIIDSKGALYASKDQGKSWELLSVNTEVAKQGTLIVNDGFIYLWDSSKILLFNREQMTWENIDNFLEKTSNEDFSSEEVIELDENDGTFYYKKDGEVIKVTNLNIRSKRQSIFQWGNTYGLAFLQKNNQILWASHGTSDNLVNLINQVGVKRAAIWETPSKERVLFKYWGATINEVIFDNEIEVYPLLWVVYLVWSMYLYIPVLSAIDYLSVFYFLFFIIIINYTINYIRVARPLGIPVWAMLFAGRMIGAYAKPDPLNNRWEEWQKIIRQELAQFGDVTQVDLLEVPNLFRQYSIQRYLKENVEKQNICVNKNRLVLLTGDRLKRWQRAWIRISHAMGKSSGISDHDWDTVHDLAEIFTQNLGMDLGIEKTFDMVKAWKVEAKSLRLNLPRVFPLIFIADPNPVRQTVQTLNEAFNVVNESGYFSVVIAIEPMNRTINIPNELYNLIFSYSKEGRDFVILDQDAIIDLFISRQPVRTLVEKIGHQVDLTKISPFVIDGPVPEGMFFGRENETRLLVEQCSKRNFALVGNRKVGKTSLLKRIKSKLEDNKSKNIKILYLDCQWYRDINSFFNAFNNEVNAPNPITSVEEFVDVVHDLRKKGLKLILILDEVDNVLLSGDGNGEHLISAWRMLSNEDCCRFIFCGSASLSRLLMNPHSGMFNFPEPLYLGYLDRETADQVLCQPLEMLNIKIIDHEVMLNEIWRLAAGHPNLIQWIGNFLVHQANKRVERYVSLEDIDEIRQSPYFIDWYFSTTWGPAKPLEKIITLVAPITPFTLSDIRILLKDLEIAIDDGHISNALKTLSILSVLKQEKKSYSFVPLSFFELLHETQEVESMIITERRLLIDKE